MTTTLVIMVFVKTPPNPIIVNIFSIWFHEIIIRFLKIIVYKIDTEKAKVIFLFVYFFINIHLSKLISNWKQIGRASVTPPCDPITGTNCNFP